MPTMRWAYRVTVAPGQLEHLPAAVGPTTDWVRSYTLRDAKQAAAATMHIVAQSLGRTRNTQGKCWRRIQGPSKAVDYYVMSLVHDPKCNIVIEAEIHPVRRI